MAQHAHRLKAVILIGTDTDSLADALSKHAPQVPIHHAASPEVASEDGPSIMSSAVRIAHELAEQNDTVLMAPAAASMDQFVSYAERGEAFIDAVSALVEKINQAGEGSAGA